MKLQHLEDRIIESSYAKMCSENGVSKPQENKQADQKENETKKSEDDESTKTKHSELSEPLLSVTEQSSDAVESSNANQNQNRMR